MAEGTNLSPLSSRASSALSSVLIAVEKAVKETLFGCRMCGQCILHSTGLVCPMRCPKNLRNGPCGGVLVDGHCEVYPDSPCVWVEAYEGSRRLPLWRDHMARVNPPVDWRLQGTSSWANLVSGRDREVPAGWSASEQRAEGFQPAGSHRKGVRR
ncbi:MAG: methylenetetrahydrofolate reductase C-terminal domain-containing protein [Thermoanaerobaculia bacterium]